MPTNILAWNIETFGIRGVDAENIRCQAVANIAADAQADVLVIQELRQAGVAKLPALQRELNKAFGGVANDWHFDWIMGAVGDGKPIPPPNAAALAFAKGANLEGYAVLYRNGRLSALAGNPLSAGQDRTTVAGGAVNHFVSLVSAGKRATLNLTTPDHPYIKFSAPHDIPWVSFSTSSSSTAVPPIDPAKSARLRPTTVGRRLATFENVLFERLSRRPCYVVLPASGPRPAYTVVVYHAPVDSPGNYYGTSIGFSVNELQGANCAYAGDYNIINSRQRANIWNWANGTLNFTQSTRDADGNWPASMVHPVQSDVWRQGAATLTRARDLGFGKTAACTMSVYANALQFAPTSNIGRFIRRNMNGIKGLLKTRFCKGLPADAATLLNNYPAPDNYPDKTDAQTAQALLYNMLASDHLPIMITIN